MIVEEMVLRDWRCLSRRAASTTKRSEDEEDRLATWPTLHPANRAQLGRLPNAGTRARTSTQDSAVSLRVSHHTLPFWRGWRPRLQFGPLAHRRALTVPAAA